MTMLYHYARKLQKGASSSSTSSSSSSNRRSASTNKGHPPRSLPNGPIPCCSSSQSNGPVRLPPPPPCVMMGVNGGLVTGGNYRFQLSPHHHHHQHQHCNPQHPHHQQQHLQQHHHPHQTPPTCSDHQHHHQCQHHHHHQQQQHPQQHFQHQQHPSHNHLLNGTCCCSSGGCSHHHPPCHNHRETPSPFPIPVEVGVDDAGSCFFYNEEDDYGNECGVVPVLCKVHNNAPLPNSSSAERREAFCDTRRRGETSNSSCGRATSASSLIPSFSDDRNRSPQAEENKDLNFDGSQLMSGTWEALVQQLLPTEAHFPSEDYIFTFLLSARLYVQPHELLGRIFQEIIDLSGESVRGDEEDVGPGPPPQVFGGQSPSHHQHPSRGNSPRPSSTSPQHQHRHHQHFRQGTNLIGTTFTNATGLLDSTDISEEDMNLPLNLIPLLVQFLRPWTELFPYDFRDDRMMAHVRILAHKCVASDEEVREQVSQLLAALLSRLAALEKYEEFLHRVTTENSIGEPIAAPSVVTICPDPATMAEQLTLIEIQRFSFIGPDEFVQTLGKEDLKTGVRHCDCTNRKTKNLEAYVRWFQRLTYYVASEICKMSKKKSRCRVCEYWVQVAKECLNIRNFNSLMAILAGLNIRPVARLKKTWSKPLYMELAEVAKAVDPQQNYAPYRKLYKASVWNSTSRSGSSSSLADNPTYRITVPYFSLLMKDIYNLDSMHPSRLKNGHIDFEKCRQLAKLVSEITSWQKVSCDFVQIPNIFNSVQASPIFNEQELIYASYLCESPESSREKEQFKKLHKQNFQVPLIACNSSSENDT